MSFNHEKLNVLLDIDNRLTVGRMPVVFQLKAKRLHYIFTNCDEAIRYIEKLNLKRYELTVQKTSLSVATTVRKSGFVEVRDLVQRFNGRENRAFSIEDMSKISYFSGRNNVQSLERFIVPGFSRLFVVGSGSLSNQGLLGCYTVVDVPTRVKCSSNSEQVRTLTEWGRQKHGDEEWRVPVSLKQRWKPNSVVVSVKGLTAIDTTQGDQWINNLHAFAI